MSTTSMETKLEHDQLSEQQWLEALAEQEREPQMLELRGLLQQHLPQQQVPAAADIFNQRVLAGVNLLQLDPSWEWDANFSASSRRGSMLRALLLVGFGLLSGALLGYCIMLGSQKSPAPKPLEPSAPMMPLIYTPQDAEPQKRPVELPRSGQLQPSR